jgi:hypothetical protein
MLVVSHSERLMYRIVQSIRDGTVQLRRVELNRFAVALLEGLIDANLSLLSIR